jgi:chromosome segregation ATPase
MFISKYEKDELHKKIDALSLLVAQATERAQKSEEKAIELSLKISSMEQLQIQQQLKLVEALEEIEEIDGLSDDMFERIKKYESRAEAVEKHVALRYRVHDDMDREIKILTNASKNATTDISRLEKRFDTFVDAQNVSHAKVKENMKILAADQNTKHEKISSIERSLEATRAILFGLKKDLGNNRKDLLELCKIAVTRDDPVFALDGGAAPKTVASEDKPTPTEGVNTEPLTKAPEAPYGLKKDGTPRKRPGRPIYNIPEIKNEQP